MAFTNNKTALSICKLGCGPKGVTREDLLAKLINSGVANFDAVSDQPVFAFAGWRFFGAPVDEANVFLGGHMCFQFLKAVRRIPGALLKDECAKAEAAFIQNNPGLDGIGYTTVPSKERKRIKQETKERLLKTMPVSIKGTQIAIDVTSGLVYVATASQAELDNIACFFYKITDIQMIRVQNSQVFENIEQLKIGNNKTTGQATYRDFLTWFWFVAEERGAKLTFSGMTIEGLLEGPVTLVSEDPNDTKGAAVATLRKGGFPQVSSEAKSALLIGKKLKKAKVTFTIGQLVWSGTFDADTFAFSGLSLPEPEEMGVESIFMGNIANLELLHAFLGAYITWFSKDMESDEIRQFIATWAEERQAL